MRERAEELGGACTVEPGSDGGTRVSARLPLETPGSRQQVSEKSKDLLAGVRSLQSRSSGADAGTTETGAKNQNDLEPDA